MRRGGGCGSPSDPSYTGRLPGQTRRAVVLAGALAATATVAVGTTSRAGATVAPGFQTVRFGQVQLDVPASWPVYDLAAEPRTCVRFDRPAVYLGVPGTDQDCPARAVGRSVAVLVTPDATGQARTALIEPAPADDAVAGLGVRELPAAGMSVRVAYGAGGDGVASRILGSVRLASASGGRSAPLVSPPTPSAPSPTPTTAPTAPGLAGQATSALNQLAALMARLSALLTTTPTAAATLPAPTAPPTGSGAGVTGADASAHALAKANLFTGAGFDACTAPSASAMRSWLTSAYRAVGVYIGGVNRACGDGNLSSGWVRSVAGQGWRVLPIYVGAQAPCVFQPGLTTIAAANSANATAQGARAADDAAADARRFALAPGSAVYFDLEAYRRGGSCTTTVLSFLSGWTQRLHQDGYRSGVYSSATSGIYDLASAAGGPTVGPDAIWVARWDNSKALYGDPAVADDKWDHHQRLKQYQGGHDESHGKVKLNIDSDALDAPLAVIQR